MLAYVLGARKNTEAVPGTFEYWLRNKKQKSVTHS